MQQCSANFMTYTKMCKLTIREYARMIKQECLEGKKNQDYKNVKKIQKEKTKQNKKTRKHKKEHKWKNLGLRNLLFPTFTRF